MKTWTLTIPGPLWGYRQGRREAHRPERVAFKRQVRLLANAVGVPDEAKQSDELFLDVRIHWRRKARIDGPNVMKLVEDALWKQDREVSGGLWIRYLGKPTEEVIITVSGRISPLTPQRE